MAGPQPEYPERNPFPVQGTASVETTGSEPQSLATDVQTPQLKHAWSQVQAYLIARPRLEAYAPVLALHGPAGSGKTHTLRYLLQRTAAEYKEGNRLYGTAYVLAGTADLDALRYAILQAIPLSTLRAVSQRFIEVIGLEHVETSPQPETAVGRQERAKLRENLPQISALIKSALIDPAQINKLQGDELREAGNDDLRNALSYIDDDELGDKARAWLCGDPLDEEVLRRLGVGKKRAADHPHRALRVVVRLFKRTGTPLLVMLDQCESFLRPDPKGPVPPESERFLQGLVELLPQEQALFAVAMSEEAWRSLQGYLRQRLGLISYQFSALSESSAHEFIHTYIHTQAPTEDAAPEIFPFKEDAVREILAGIQGNVRRFLQTCHEAFKLASPKAAMITLDIVRRALKEAKRERPSLELVIAQTRSLLRDRGLDSSDASIRAVSGGSTTARISQVIENREGTPLALLEVSESLFIDDEAKQGLKTVDAIIRATNDARRLPVVVVIVGYASPEILTRLSEATPHVVVYEPEGFRDRFVEVLEKFQGNKVGIVQPAVASIDLGPLRDELVRLVESRTHDAQRTAVSAVDVLQRQEEARIQELWRSARTNWPRERKQIEDQIKAARGQRATEELAALEWERGRAVKERARRLAVRWGAGLVLVDAWLFSRYPFYVELYTTLIAVSLSLAAAGYAAHAYVFAGPLWGKVRSIDELNDLAGRLARTTTPTRGDLASNNPQLRYAAVRALKDSHGYPRRSVTGLISSILPWFARGLDVPVAAETEVNPTVRRAMAMWGRVNEYTLRDWPERVYRFDSSSLDRMLDETLSRRSQALVSDVRSDSSMLRKAYDHRIAAEDWPQLLRVSTAAIQAVLKEISPLERPGLGTADYLRQLAEIDDLYLFFRQLMYYIELDLPVTAEPVVSQ